MSWPTDLWKLVRLNGSKPQPIVSAIKSSERSVVKVQIGSERECSTLARWGSFGWAHCPSAVGISPEMEWLCDKWSIGRWTSCRADSRHARSPERWPLPRRISGLFWMASFAQETPGSPYCCFSSKVTRDKHTKLTTWTSSYLANTLIINEKVSGKHLHSAMTDLQCSHSNPLAGRWRMK